MDFTTYEYSYSLCSMNLCGFSYVMLREKLRKYVSSLPYSTNLTYDKGTFFILFYAGTIQCNDRTIVRYRTSIIPENNCLKKLKFHK